MMTWVETRQICAVWWRHALANRTDPRHRALRARLRRAGLLEVLIEPEVHDLAKRLEVTPANAEALVRTVKALAELDGTWDTLTAGGEGTEQLPTLAAAFGRKQKERSHTRFQRLIRSHGEDLTAQLRRAIALVDRSCDPGKLGADLFHWSDRVRTRWSFDYFSAHNDDGHTAHDFEETGA